mmetsp:Transcript_24908/g.37851  ORF Transcript_24908/g.37851 Transcript_24908/m.37851 type:complete len:282 (-) Transcript_24908:325-1170(-)
MSNSLNVLFRDDRVPVKYPNVSKECAEEAVKCGMFKRWIARCEQIVDNKTMNIHEVEIQPVDMFGKRGVGFVKIKADVSLVVNGKEEEKKIPGIAFLRGDAVGILVALCCEDGKVYTVLVEQPRVPLGTVRCIELPAGMIDDNDTVKGIVIKELKEECGITVKKSELTELTKLAYEDAYEKGHIPSLGMMPSPGGCDEMIGLYYVEKKVTVTELNDMQGRLEGNREEGEHIQLHIVPYDDAWKYCGDSKLLSAMFLYEKLRQKGKILLPGTSASPLTNTNA